MPDKYYLLSERDRQFLQELIRENMRKLGNPVQRPAVPEADQLWTPETYMARTPEGGIPGAVCDTEGDEFDGECNECTDEPDCLLVTFTGVENGAHSVPGTTNPDGDCPCSEFNGTYVLTRTAPCTWKAVITATDCQLFPGLGMYSPGGVAPYIIHLQYLPDFSGTTDYWLLGIHSEQTGYRIRAYLSAASWICRGVNTISDWETGNGNCGDTSNIVAVVEPCNAEDGITGTGSLNDSALVGTGYLLNQAECDIYRLIQYSDGQQLERVVGVTRRVYNPDPEPIPGNTFVLITRDKFGTWYVANRMAECAIAEKKWYCVEAGEIDTGTGTGCECECDLAACWSVWAGFGTSHPEHCGNLCGGNTLLVATGSCTWSGSPGCVQLDGGAEFSGYAELACLDTQNCVWKLTLTDSYCVVGTYYNVNPWSYDSPNVMELATDESTPLSTSVILPGQVTVLPASCSTGQPIVAPGRSTLQPQLSNISRLAQRTCLLLSDDERDALVTRGLTIHGGPYESLEVCDEGCAGTGTSLPFQVCFQPVKESDLRCEEAKLNLYERTSLIAYNPDTQCLERTEGAWGFVKTVACCEQDCSDKWWWCVSKPLTEDALCGHCSQVPNYYRLETDIDDAATSDCKSALEGAFVLVHRGEPGVVTCNWIHRYYEIPGAPFCPETYLGLAWRFTRVAGQFSWSPDIWTLTLLTTKVGIDNCPNFQYPVATWTISDEDFDCFGTNTLTLQSINPLAVYALNSAPWVGPCVSDTNPSPWAIPFANYVPQSVTIRALDTLTGTGTDELTQVERVCEFGSEGDKNNWLAQGRVVYDGPFFSQEDCEECSNGTGTETGESGTGNVGGECCDSTPITLAATMDVRCEGGSLNIYERTITLAITSGQLVQTTGAWVFARAEGCCECAATGTGSEVGTGTSTGTTAETGTGTGTTAGTGTEAGTGSETGTGSEVGTGTADTGTGTGTSTGSDAETGTGTGSEVGLWYCVEPPAGTGTGGDTGTGTSGGGTGTGWGTGTGTTGTGGGEEPGSGTGTATGTGGGEGSGTGTGTSEGGTGTGTSTSSGSGEFLTCTGGYGTRSAYQLLSYATSSPAQDNIAQSDDHGATFSVLSTNTASSSYSYPVAQSADGQRIWRVTSGSAFYSNNQAGSWTDSGKTDVGEVRVSADGKYVILLVEGFAHYGVESSNDYGATWNTFLTLASNTAPTSVAVSADGCWMVAATASTGNSFRYSEDGGATWTAHVVDAAVRSAKVCVANSGEMFFAKDNTIKRGSVAGGFVSETFAADYEFSCICCSPDGQTVLATTLGDSGAGDNPRIIRSTDAGDNWTTVLTGPNQTSSFTRVDISDDGTYALASGFEDNAGVEYKFWRSDDGGATWSDITPANVTSEYGVSM